ncbi:MAG TPA: hypothetical protein ENI34_10495 [candidate division WOR-3 bacterium]|uniref:Uncharacterized protein n=1 Tax=candidate division WOR-3 bacterium TaxID=2052148 RepID=A0A9C9EPK4_UNCW3|nr:hypothetical protein [candidate division WOR-3 bacterium]
MKWSVHPAKDNQTKTIVSLVFIFGFLIFIAVFYGVFWAVFGFIVLFLSLHSYYFPTRYEANDERIIIKNIFATQKRRLTEFKKVYRGKNGLLLSPFKHKTFLNKFRGVFLLLPQDENASQVIFDFFLQRIEQEEEKEQKE